MKLGHNDHLMVGIIIYTWKEFDPQGAERRAKLGEMVLKSSGDFSFETTGHTLIKFGHNDHLVVGIRMYTWKMGGVLAETKEWCSGYC